jgi:outer membrane receptor for ferrienterochelin and colicin
MLTIPRLPLALLAAAGLFLSTPGLSAQLPTQGASLEEVVVTAKFRDTPLMDAIGSISVLPESTITERAAQHLQDILNAVPNVNWAAGASRARFVQIRGVGDLEQYYDPKYYPAVGVMLDDLELGDTANAGMLFDINQVEVLRGPQGTRFGASGHAGMIFMRSNAPTEHFEGALSGGVGNYASNNLGLVLSGPLNDTLSARLAVQQNNSDGYIDNEQQGSDNTNNIDELTSRGRVRWTPTESTQYEFSASYFDANNGYDPWSLDNNRTTNSDQPGEDSQKLATVTGAGDWTLNDNHAIAASLSYSTPTCTRALMPTGCQTHSACVLSVLPATIPRRKYSTASATGSSPTSACWALTTVPPALATATWLACMPTPVVKAWTTSVPASGTATRPPTATTIRIATPCMESTNTPSPNSSR